MVVLILWSWLFFLLGFGMLICIWGFMSFGLFLCFEVVIFGLWYEIECLEWGLEVVIFEIDGFVRVVDVVLGLLLFFGEVVCGFGVDVW